MNCPAIAAIWLVPSARPRCSAGKASVRIAAEFAVSMDPPTAWSTRQPMSQTAAAPPRNGSNERRIEAAANTAKPTL